MAYRYRKPVKRVATSSKWDVALDHRCAQDGCGQFGPFGVGPITQPQFVVWWCRSHLPADFYKFRDAQ